ERDLHWRRAKLVCHIGQRGRLKGCESTERKKRYVGDSITGQTVDQRIVMPISDVVLVLHADDLADPAPCGDLRGRHVAQADMSYASLPLEVSEHHQRCIH